MDDKDKNRNMSVSNDKTENQQPVKNRHFCDKCGEGFTYLSNLKIHKRKHTGEKPYACHLCDKSFIQSFGLKSHLKVHYYPSSFYGIVLAECVVNKVLVLLFCQLATPLPLSLSPPSGGERD